MRVVQCHRVHGSPFLAGGALEALASTTKHARALVSTPEELARLSPSARRSFSRLLVLAEPASADPEGEDELENRLRGLHAKLYVATKRSTTNLWIGSANATNAGLLDGRNVEILVQLRTKGTARPIDDFLGDDGMGPLLEPFDPKTEPIIDSASRRRLEDAQQLLACAPLRLRAVRVEEDEQDASAPAKWRVVLESESAIAVAPQVSARAWPISTARTAAVDVTALFKGEGVPLAATELSLVTRLIAFELRDGDEALTFVRNLPLIDPPPGRDGELLHAVIGNRDRFLALMLALFGDSQRAFGSLLGNDRAYDRGAGISGTSADGAGLLEHLVRACVRDRDRLREALSLVDSLAKSERGAALIPDGFPELLALLNEVSQ